MSVSETEPLDRPLQLFTGKGGVGKTTLVAACALGAAKKGHRPLIVELGHRASIPHVFASSADGAASELFEVGYAPREVKSGVYAMNMEFDASVEEYLVDTLRVSALARRVAQSRTLRRFFEAAPAVAEVATLHKLEKLLREGAYHPIFVDLDATGHALMFLELPRVFDVIAESGPLRAMLDRVTAVLSDPSRACLHLVTLPSALPMRETLELHARLRMQSAIALGHLFVNRVPEVVRTSDGREVDLEVLRRVARELGDAWPSASADFALGCAEIHRRQRAWGYLEEIEATFLDAEARDQEEGPGIRSLRVIHDGFDLHRIAEEVDEARPTGGRA